MKTISFLGIIAFTLICITGCLDSVNESGEGTEDIRLRDNVDDLEERMSHENAGLIYINDSQTDKMSSARKAKLAGDNNFSFALAAQVYPPEYEGNLLRATHVDVAGNYAYVTYNTEGEPYLGGVDVIDISDINNPQLVISAELPNVDLSSVAVDGASCIWLALLR